MLSRPSRALRQARHPIVGRNIVDPRNIIRAGIAASVALHSSFLALAVLFSEVRPFGPVVAENVAVDVVTPDQVPDKAPEPTTSPKPQTFDAFDLSSKPAPDSSTSGSSASDTSSPGSSAKPSTSATSQSSASQSSASQPPATQPSAAAAAAASQPQTPAQSQQEAALTPASNPAPNPASTPDRQQPAAPPQASAPAQSPTLGYVQPQPDISVKYHVQLGLPQNRPGQPFDGPATENADIEASSIAEFRRRLRDCSKLPESIAPTDDLAIKLRVKLSRDGRLAAEPLLVEAKASPKGPLLIQAAIGALHSCQPYTMLPADKYNEWKVLDFTFTPRDFGAS